MRIFPDTNVLISAFLSDGVCHQLLRLVAGGPEHDLVIGAFVLEETKQQLRDPRELWELLETRDISR